MKNATTPMTATPPATDKPMIEPVPRPESEEAGGGVATGVVLGVAEPVRMTRESERLIVVRTGVAERDSEVSVRDGGKDDEEEVVDDLAVSDEAELAEVVVVVELRLLVLVLVVLVSVVVVVEDGRGRISLCAAAKYEKRSGRRTDDHFIVAGKGEKERQRFLP
jgi:hypothetical protein